MKQIYAVVALLVIIFESVAPAYAGSVMRSGGTISIEADQHVEGDFYGVGEMASVTGEIQGDAYLLSGTAVVNGVVGADFTAMTGNAQVHGSVADDVRVVAGEVVIADTVGGDVFIIAGKLNVLSSASIEGDVYFYGESADISGPIKGALRGAAQSIRVDAPVGAGIEVTSATLTLGDRAVVTGDVRYTSGDDIVRAQNASVSGQVMKSQSVESANESSSAERFSLVVSLAMLFATFVALLLFKKELSALASLVILSPGRSVGLGLGGIFLGPVVVILLLVTVIGSIVGIVALLLLIALYILAVVLAPVVAGAFIARAFGQNASADFLYVLAGAATLILLGFIPVVGPFLQFACYVFSFGGILYGAYRQVA